MATTVINENNAELIEELLTNAGWLDDPRENLAYIEKEDGKEAAITKRDEVNDLIERINILLDREIQPIIWS